MKRQAMTDGNGNWFNIESADCFNEDSNWNGSNNISLATGSQWGHEALYRTVGGKWVLNSWSNWQGVLETWEIVNNEFAAKWLVTNNQNSDIVNEQIEELEI